MAEPHGGPDSLEVMAFQLILVKLGTLEQALEAIPPLLTKIVDALDAKAPPPALPTATYTQLYPELAEDDLEGSAVPAALSDPHPAVQPRRVWVWFRKKDTP